jgi:predicted ATP-grasp superfamily ATP-dependent carboligase
LGANADGSALESLIANLTNYPDRDPAKLIEAAAQISESGIPLEKLEEQVKALMAEKETLQREIDDFLMCCLTPTLFPESWKTAA